jgi:hypothetical protein
VVLDLGRLDLGPPLVLLCHNCLELVRYLVAW